MKLHILGNPNKPSSPNHREDYFSYDVYKFIKHLHKSFKMIHYGIPGSEVDCKHFDLPVGNVVQWNFEANRLIGENKSPGDIILCFYGADNHPATKGHEDLKIIEPHIGYRTTAVFAPYRIFVSYAQMHYYYGQQGMLMNPSWFDAVIPNAMDIDEFDFRENKGDYVFYLGRVQEDKGINLAIQATEKAKKRLVIAGSPKSLAHLNYAKIPKHVELVGSVNVEERKKLLANAMCLIAPTHYIEPFGNIVVEAHLSGTPTITTDWGGFVDTNIHGVTGFRCRMFSDFVHAIKNIKMIDPATCRKIAEAKYSDEVVYEQMRNYILRVARGDWYQEVGVPTVETKEAMPEHIKEQWRAIEAKVRQEIERKLFEESWEREVLGEDNLRDLKVYPLTYKEVFGDKFTVIIPSMGMSNEAMNAMVIRYQECPLVGEVLIVDNGNHGMIEPSLSKVRIIYSGPNIYVNPAWNMGVEQAKYDKIILANDDLLLDDIDGLLEFISGRLVDGMVIGLNPDQSGHHTLDSGHFIGSGWGRFIAITKASYKPIPEELKVWFGDNLLAELNQPFSISGVKGTIGGSASCELPEIQPIIGRDSELWPSLVKPYRARPKHKICHIIMSCGRLDYLERTLHSMVNINFGDHEVYRILVDDYPNGRDDKLFLQLANNYQVDNLILSEENKGLTQVWSNLWDLVKDMDFDYILHQEDDVVLGENIRMDSWIKILESSPENCSAVLTRQKWYHHEEEVSEKGTDDIICGYRVEYRQEVFSPMMSLYRHYLTKEPIREEYGYNLNEWMIMDYLKKKGQRSAFIKSASGKNLITHIGDYFHGKRLLPGEAGFEKFAHYDPDKFYCSKTGKPRD